MRRSLTQLRVENEALRREVMFLRQHPKLARGLRGEDLILKVVRGSRSPNGSGFDVLGADNRLRIEVKYSSLLSMRRKDTKRWAWTKIFGELGRKRFHRLVLVGETDPRFSHLYSDPRAPYVLFDLPYREAVRLTSGIRPGRSSVIHLTTNPASIRAERAKALYGRFQTTVKHLQRRYFRRHLIAIQSSNLTDQFEADASPSTLRAVALAVQLDR